MIESTYAERLEATYQAILKGDIVLEDGVSPWEEPESPEEFLICLKLAHRLADKIGKDLDEVIAHCEATCVPKDGNIKDAHWVKRKDSDFQKICQSLSNCHKNWSMT